MTTTAFTSKYLCNKYTQKWNAYKNEHKIQSVSLLRYPLLYLDEWTFTIWIPLQQYTMPYTYLRQLLAHFHFWHQPKAFPPHGTCWLHCAVVDVSCVNAIFMYHFESVALNSNTIYTFTFTLGKVSSDDLPNKRAIDVDREKEKRNEKETKYIINWCTVCRFKMIIK